MKQKIHNEWFQKLSKTTCKCGKKNVETYSWGEYVSARWRTITHFCESCFKVKVLERLETHGTSCGCTFKLQAKGFIPPNWLKLND